MSNRSDLLPYLELFGMAYAIVFILTTVFSIASNINLHIEGMTGGLVYAASYSATVFIKENKRTISTHERDWLAWYSLVAGTFVIVLITLIRIFLYKKPWWFNRVWNSIHQVDLFLLYFGILLVILGGAYFILLFSYDWLAKLQYSYLKKKGEI